MARNRNKHDVGDMVTFINSKNEIVVEKIKLKMYVEEDDRFDYFLEGQGWIPEKLLSKYSLSNNNNVLCQTIDQ